MEKAYRHVTFLNDFFDNPISPYGLSCGRVDYRTLAKSFDAVMCNDIMDICHRLGEEPEYLQGEYRLDTNGTAYEVAEAEEMINRIQAKLDSGLADEDAGLRKKLQREIGCLSEVHDVEDIYQYYIISERGARILQRYTFDPLWYCEALDIYIWGITHYGTAWQYVLTCIPCDILERAEEGN